MVKFSPFIYYNVCPIIWIGASFLVPVALLVAFCLGSVMVTVTLVMYLSPNTVRSLIYLNFVGSSSITKALSKVRYTTLNSVASPMLYSSPRHAIC